MIDYHEGCVSVGLFFCLVEKDNLADILRKYITGETSNWVIQTKFAFSNVLIVE